MAEKTFGEAFTFARGVRAGLTHDRGRFAGYCVTAPYGFYPDERERAALEDERIATRRRAFHPGGSVAVKPTARASRLATILSRRLAGRRF
jgi:hypothetical protein